MNTPLVWRVLRAEGAAAVADRLRDRLAEAWRRRSFRPAKAPPPGFSCAVLNLAATAPAPRLGGVQAQLLWRLAAEAERRPVALLYREAAAAGGGFRLELQAGKDRCALRWPPAGDAELTATALTDPALERAVAWSAASCGATTVQVEGLAGMPLASLLRLRQAAGLRLVLAIHDFAAFCPRPHLLESQPPPAPPRFCHYSRDSLRCERCLGRDFAGLPHGYQEERRELARQLLASADAVVYPSAFLAKIHDELFAGAGRAIGRVIAPAAASTHRPQSRRVQVRPGPPRHVAWVGAVQPHKGALVFEAAVERLAAAGRRLRFSAYGGGDREILARWRRLPGLRVRGYYRAGSLPALLHRDRVDLALLLSVVPESYGLALDECAAAGVPVVAFDLGAPAERLAAAGSGLLLAAPLADDPAAGGAALANLLADLLDGGIYLPLAAAPPLRADSVGAPVAAEATLAAWLALYRELGLLGSRPPLRNG